MRPPRRPQCPLGSLTYAKPLRYKTELHRVPRSA
ncbi:protein of unknown function (plasmid) [Azospirillum baldaniorum]|uniref:Uncharacterized protein n=1 Tax=Azospirillum baldaniorum TaxID=1064539 RepID=A0A9P1JX51_9PROT|nr:protein of unknown function [Azospirillum baldaniorum]